MVSESMVERVARAMAANDSGPQGSTLFDIHWSEFGEGYVESARVAIEEMREPTSLMWDVLDDYSSSYHPESAYKAAIDAALGK